MNPKSLIPITTAIFLILLTIPTHACSETHGCFQVTWKPIYMGLFTQKYLINIKNICNTNQDTITRFIIYNATFTKNTNINVERIEYVNKTVTKTMHPLKYIQYYFSNNPWNISTSELYNFTNQTFGIVDNATLSQALVYLTNNPFSDTLTVAEPACKYIDNTTFYCLGYYAVKYNETIKAPIYIKEPVLVKRHIQNLYMYLMNDSDFLPNQSKQFLVTVHYPYHVVNHKLQLAAEVAIEINGYIYHPWFNLSWYYRVPIYITHTPRVAKIRIPYLTGMQGNFSDLRFTYYNPITQNETELPYWISYYQPYKYAIVYVRLNPPVPINTNNATIYVYYDNPTAPPASNFTATITEIPMQINVTFPPNYAFAGLYDYNGTFWLMGSNSYFGLPLTTTPPSTFEVKYGHINSKNVSDYAIATTTLNTLRPVWPLYPRPAYPVLVASNNGSEYVFATISQNNNYSVNSSYTGYYNFSVGLSAFIYNANNLSNYEYYVSKNDIYTIMNYHPFGPTATLYYLSYDILPGTYKDTAYFLLDYRSPGSWPQVNEEVLKLILFMFNASSMKIKPVYYFGFQMGRNLTLLPIGYLGSYYGRRFGMVSSGFTHIYGPYYAVLCSNVSEIFNSTSILYPSWVNNTIYELYLNGSEVKFVRNVSVFNELYNNSYGDIDTYSNNLYCPSLDICYVSLYHHIDGLTYLIRMNMTNGNKQILTSFNLTNLLNYTHNYIIDMGSIDNGTTLYFVTGPYNVSHFLYNIKQNKTYFINYSALPGIGAVFMFGHLITEHLFTQNTFPQSSFIDEQFLDNSANQTNISIWTIPVFAQPAINITLNYSTIYGPVQVANSPPNVTILFPYPNAYTNQNIIQVIATDDNNQTLNLSIYLNGTLIYNNDSYINNTIITVNYTAPQNITPYVVYATASDGQLTGYSDYIYFHYAPFLFYTFKKYSFTNTYQIINVSTTLQNTTNAYVELWHVYALTTSAKVNYTMNLTNFSNGFYNFSAIIPCGWNASIVYFNTYVTNGTNTFREGPFAYICNGIPTILYGTTPATYPPAVYYSPPAAGGGGYEPEPVIQVKSFATYVKPNECTNQSLIVEVSNTWLNYNASILMRLVEGTPSEVLIKYPSYVELSPGANNIPLEICSYKPGEYVAQVYMNISQVGLFTGEVAVHSGLLYQKSTISKIKLAGVLQLFIIFIIILILFGKTD